MPQESNIILTQRAKVAEAKRSLDAATHVLEIETAKLAGMELVAESFAGVVRIPPSQSKNNLVPLAKRIEIMAERRQKGRQVGAISKQWRDALHFLFLNYPDGFLPANAAAAANAAGLPNVQVKEANLRMGAYLTLGYIEMVDDKFRVTNRAAEKYGFSRERIKSSASEPAEGP